MQRVMIVGQPGSGKSRLARAMGEITHLPVVHMDHIHWKPGWQERAPAQKAALVAEVHARPRWIFEGGHSASWEARLARADVLIWLDFGLWRRYGRVFWRTVAHWGRTRPDLPQNCPERFSAEFTGYIWRTRHSGRDRVRTLFERAEIEKHRLRSNREVAAYLGGLRQAARTGNLGIWHRG